MTLNWVERFLEQVMLDIERDDMDSIQHLKDRIEYYDCLVVDRDFTILEVCEENNHLKVQLRNLESSLVRQQGELDRLHRKLLLGVIP